MIEIRSLHKSFGAKNVLNGVDLTIQTGETMCVIGRSGCGKSVLLKHIVGLLAPDDGTVFVDGKEVQTLRGRELFELRRGIGYVFQGAALFDSMTVWENVVLGLYEHGERHNEVLDGEARRVLAAVGLLPDEETSTSATFEKEYAILRHKKPSDLSGGMRKRVGVARALVGSPKYILYDEPTTGLDPITSEQIDNLILELAQKLNVTSIVITHDMFSVYKVAKTVAMLEQGTVRFFGTADGLRASTDEVVQEFIERYE
ncbi:MAG: ATP-binding cassette domain-containing protein [Candidatus Kapabacteria bacterium]|jgi:phospholipid/cholesterol/gamma-HCH transport system ATP-binding protein|nr:ATP-binding cassette domain-containing protein [Candidatus Kapabacteria bacterium]